MLIITILFWVQFICTLHFDTLFISLNRSQKKPESQIEKGQWIISLARKKNHEKVCGRDTLASSYFFSMYNGSVVVEENAKYPVLNFNEDYVVNLST